MSTVGAWALVLALAAGGTAAKPEPPPDPPPGASAELSTRLKGADPGLLEEVRNVAERVAALRGQAFARPVLAVRAPASLREAAATIRANEVLPRPRLEARGRAWQAIGLGEPHEPLALVQLLATDLAGIGFDPAGNRLLVAEERLTGLDFDASTGAEGPATVLAMTGVRPDEILLAHMLTHVRQRERTGGDWLESTTDGLLGRAAWAEGEANLVALRHLFESMGLADAVLEHGLEPGTVLDGRLIPAGLAELSPLTRELAGFVFGDGFDRAVEAYRAGGWERLDAEIAVAAATRDVWHPERAATPPATFPDPPSPPLPGLLLADEDVLGERAVVALIARWTGKDNLALIAGDGWTGDRLRRWEREGAAVTEWITHWTDDPAAADFDYAMVRALGARFPTAKLEAASEADRWLVAEGQVFRLRRAGVEVRLRVAPTELDARLEGPAKSVPASR